MASEDINIYGTLDVIQANGKYYLISDSYLRQNIERWQSARSIDPSTNFLTSASAVYYSMKSLESNIDEKLEDKVDVETFDELIGGSGRLAEVAFTGKYEDLIDIPSFGGARVQGTTLVFTGKSTGMEAVLLEDLDTIAAIIGSGVV